MSKDSHFIEGLLFGGLLGAAAALLFAPATGDIAREKLKQKLKDLELDDVIDKFIEAFDEGKEEAHRVSEELDQGT